MSQSWMSAQVNVTTGQPLTAWLPAKNARLVRFVLYCEDGAGGVGHLVPEGADELDGGGNAVHSEIIQPQEDPQAAAGQQKTVELRFCQYPYVRLSAHADAPGYVATTVRGGIEVIQ